MKSSEGVVPAKKQEKPVVDDQGYGMMRLIHENEKRGGLQESRKAAAQAELDAQIAVAKRNDPHDSLGATDELEERVEQGWKHYVGDSSKAESTGMAADAVSEEAVQAKSEPVPATEDMPVEAASKTDSQQETRERDLGVVEGIRTAEGIAAAAAATLSEKIIKRGGPENKNILHKGFEAYTKLPKKTRLAITLGLLAVSGTITGLGLAGVAVGGVGVGIATGAVTLGRVLGAVGMYGTIDVTTRTRLGTFLTQDNEHVRGALAGAGATLYAMFVPQLVASAAEYTGADQWFSSAWNSAWDYFAGNTSVVGAVDPVIDNSVVDSYALNNEYGPNNSLPEKPNAIDPVIDNSVVDSYALNNEYGPNNSLPEKPNPTGMTFAAEDEMARATAQPDPNNHIRDFEGLGAHVNPDNQIRDFEGLENGSGATESVPQQGGAPSPEAPAADATPPNSSEPPLPTPRPEVPLTFERAYPATDLANIFGNADPLNNPDIKAYFDNPERPLTTAEQNLGPDALPEQKVAEKFHTYLAQQFSALPQDGPGVEALGEQLGYQKPILGIFGDGTFGHGDLTITPKEALLKLAQVKAGLQA